MAILSLSWSCVHQRTFQTIPRAASPSRPQGRCNSLCKGYTRYRQHASRLSYRGVVGLTKSGAYLVGTANLLAPGRIRGLSKRACGLLRWSVHDVPNSFFQALDSFPRYLGLAYRQILEFHILEVLEAVIRDIGVVQCQIL